MNTIIHLTENRAISVCEHIFEDIINNIFRKKTLETKLLNSETGDFAFLLIHKEILAFTIIIDNSDFDISKIAINILKL